MPVSGTVGGSRYTLSCSCRNTMSFPAKYQSVSEFALIDSTHFGEESSDPVDLLSLDIGRDIIQDWGGILLMVVW